MNAQTMIYRLRTRLAVRDQTIAELKAVLDEAEMSNEALRGALESSEMSNEALRGALGAENGRVRLARQENQRLSTENAMMRTHVCANTAAEREAHEEFWRAILFGQR